jgi:predicted ATPase
VIRQVTLRRFKRFEDQCFDLREQIVLAGPNNTGKTTLLQAIASWSLAFDRWRERNDFQRHGGAYVRQPLTRQAFAAVPLRNFDLLWNERAYRGSVEIEIRSDDWSITMELQSDTSEQIYVRPKRDAAPETVRAARLPTVFVPSMSGLSTDEPVYQRPKVQQLLGQGKPGEVIRNLLVEAHESPEAWGALTHSIRRLFNYELVPPDAGGADIIAEYRPTSGFALDIASAGSGFQQVLMLLTFLHTRPGSVLLIDEPDAHLHVFLQDAIYGELRRVAAAQRSQLIVATHSEVIINSVAPQELCALFVHPRGVANEQERERLGEAMRLLSNLDVILARDAPGVLYLEGHTDLDNLRAWARVLDHPIAEFLNSRVFWKPIVFENRLDAPGIRAEQHYASLQLVRRDLPALRLVDGDDNPNLRGTPITGAGLQRLRWPRYEIESYLVHPAALERFVEREVGSEGAAPHLEDLRAYLADNLPPAVLREPLGDHDYLNQTKARTNILPPALGAAGLHGVAYTRYHEIAASMLPEEIHPDVTMVLDGIRAAFKL